MWSHVKRYEDSYIGIYERQNKLKELRRCSKENCEREHGQKHKREHQRRTVKRQSFGEN